MQAQDLDLTRAHSQVSLLFAILAGKACAMSYPLPRPLPIPFLHFIQLWLRSKCKALAQI